MAQFSDTERDISQDKKDHFAQVFSAHFTDLAYNCLMILRSADDPEVNPYINQVGLKLRKIGAHRLRAMELLHHLMSTMAKAFDIKDSKNLSVLLRRKLIDTMLYMIVTFPFCSLSNQHALLILNTLRESFDMEDIRVLKQFVQRELDRQMDFIYSSNRKTTGMNMGQIIQMAIELRNLTQQALDDESSSGDEDDENAAARRAEIGEWFAFCKEKISKIEKVWNRKLEDNASED